MQPKTSSHSAVPGAGVFGTMEHASAGVHRDKAGRPSMDTRTKARHMVIALALCVSLAPVDARAQGDRAQADKTLSPYFFIEGGDPSIDRLPLKDTRVDVAITGIIADVTVRQVYENHGSRPIHARYIFPAST